MISLDWTALAIRSGLEITRDSSRVFCLAIPRNLSIFALYYEYINMSKPLFSINTDMKPAGDQPQAISKLTEGLSKGFTKQTLLGVTGSGKTFTAANIIANYGKPTLVIAHNKTLAAQLAQEYRQFFPNNAVHYFVSYYDYYQPEAYIPSSDTYIEKEAMINEEIERLRHASTQALLTRKDVVIVASVSCIYGLGSPDEYLKVNMKLAVGMELSRAELMRKLIARLMPHPESYEPRTIMCSSFRPSISFRATNRIRMP